MGDITMSSANPLPLPSSTTTATKAALPTHLVSKPTPYTFTPSYLTTTDPNPLPATTALLSLPRSDLNSTLATLARDGTQSLLIHLLTTTTITSHPDGLLMTLPPTTPPLLPRWKPLPKLKVPTKWESFASKKGIGKFGGSAKGGAHLAEKRKNQVYDEEKGEWVRKWGYKGKNTREGGEWLVEVDEKKQKTEQERGAGSVRSEGKRERMERMRRQERKERSNNNKRGRKSGG